jgi:hypothetical protein
MQSFWYTSMIFTHAYELLLYTSCNLNKKQLYTMVLVTFVQSDFRANDICAK